MAKGARREAAVKPAAPVVPSPPLEDVIGVDLASLVSGLRVDVDASIVKYTKRLETLLTTQCGPRSTAGSLETVFELPDSPMLGGFFDGKDWEDDVATGSAGVDSVFGVEEETDSRQGDSAGEETGSKQGEPVGEHVSTNVRTELSKTFQSEEQEREKKSRLLMQRKSMMEAGGVHNPEPAGSPFPASRKLIPEQSGESCRMLVRRMVSSKVFDLFSCMLILTNTMVFGVEAQYLAKTRELEAPVVFKVVSLLYTLVFLLELILRIFAHGGGQFFCGSDRGWNTFDASIVGISVVELVVFVLDGIGAATVESTDQLVYMRMLRIARTVRILRVVRIISFFRSLRLLLLSVLNTMKSLFWTVMLLLIILYMFGVMFTQAATQHLAVDNFEIEDLERYWGTLFLSVYTLYKAITNGLDWELAVHPLSELGWTWTSLFIVYIAFTYFAVLNVVTGVFCQTAIESAVKDQDEVMQSMQDRKKAYIEQLTALFNDVDVNGSGDLTIDEFEMLLGDERLQKYCASLDITIDDAWALFKLLDKDGNGEICITEFVTGCLRLQGAARSVDLALTGYQLQWLIDRLVHFFQYSDEQFRDLRMLVEPVRNLSKQVSATIQQAPAAAAAPPSPRGKARGAAAAKVPATPPPSAAASAALGGDEGWGGGGGGGGGGPGSAGWDPHPWICTS